MEIKQKVIAHVKSPSKESHLRDGNGFSLNEIKQADVSINILRELNIKVDYFRKSAHQDNTDKLKSIELPKQERKRRQPFVKREKKITPFKPKTEKRIVKKPVKPKTPPVKPTSKPKKKEKEIPIKLEKIPKPTGIPLTELAGLGATTAKKLIELGVNSVEDLLKENADELATLIKGVSVDRIIKWIEEGKQLIK
ncbi:MAG: helix-hairpin-helix domain-containing protein [Promethearchaeota archaeon]